MGPKSMDDFQEGDNARISCATFEHYRICMANICAMDGDVQSIAFLQRATQRLDKQNIRG